MAKHTIGIYGVYGKNNLGDEALLEAVKDDVRTIYPDCEIIVFCSDAEGVKSIHGDFAILRKPFKNIFYKISLIRSMDAFIVGGGTLVYEQGGFGKNVMAILALYYWPIIARIFGVKTIAYGQGIGPVNSLSMRVSAILLPHIFNLVTMRDGQSAKYIKENSKCYVTSDPVAASRLFEPEKTKQITDIEDYLLIAFRIPQSAKRALIQQWSESCLEYVKQSDCKIILFPTQLSLRHVEDEIVLKECEQILLAGGINPDRIQWANWNNIREGIRWLQGAKVVLSNRLHALLLAAKAGVPCVGLGGKDKIYGCLGMIGLDKPVYFIEQDKVNPELLSEILIEAWDTDVVGKKRIRKDMSLWVSREPTNLTLLKSVLLQ